MNSVKENLHSIIDTFNDEEFLRSVYEILKEKDDQHAGKIWKNLTNAQQQEVIRSASEINQPEKQVGHTDMIKKNQQWLGNFERMVSKRKRNVIEDSHHVCWSSQALRPPRNTNKKG